MATYLDHGSTTPMRPEALAAMLPYLTERFGNPSGSHALARAARSAIDDAREDMAGGLGCEPGEIVFTGSGTEADNLAVLGAQAAGGGSVVCSAVEHHAVLLACRSVGGAVVGVDGAGLIDLDALAETVRPGVGLVSVMLVNNEVGTIQPLAEVAAVVRRRAPGAVLHTDAVAAVPWLDVAEAARAADLVSVSAHKFGGPNGVGALVVRRGTRLGPVLHGGAQENGRRPGTHDVAGIVGMAAAFTAALAGRGAEVARVAALRDRLADGLLGAIDDAVETGRTGSGGDRTSKVAGSCHLLVPGVDQEELLLLADDAGVYASAGAACASGALEPSHVLLALGLSGAEARTAVRFSLGSTSTEADVDRALAVIPKVVEQLRR
jgi:cysteine desulfurase